MKHRTLRISSIVAVIAVVIGIAGSAAARPERHQRGPGNIEEKIARLDLSAETETAVYAILDEARPTQRTLRSQLRAQHDDLRALMDAESVDEEAVMAQIEAIGALETESRKHDIRTLLRVRALLSPDEREQLTRRREPRDRDSRS